MATFAAYHGLHPLIESENLREVAQKAKDFLLDDVEGATATNLGARNYVVTIWCEGASLMLGVVVDDADGINLHKLPAWRRYDA
jgi:hypothetical protein